MQVKPRHLPAWERVQFSSLIKEGRRVRGRGTPQASGEGTGERGTLALFLNRGVGGQAAPDCSWDAKWAQCSQNLLCQEKPETVFFP